MFGLQRVRKTFFDMVPFTVSNIFCLVRFRLGGKEGATQSCSGCKGRGIKVTIRQLGPGMVQQMQSVCPDCRGEGEKFL